MIEDMKVHPSEKKMIEWIRDIGYGSIKEIVVHDGLPQYIVFTEERKIKLS